MGTSAQEQDRAAGLDATARDLLSAGNPRAARQAARQELERVAKALADTDPAAGALADAWLTGSLAAIAAALPARRPPSPPGYRGGPPSAAHLTAAYEAARRQAAGK